MVRDRLADLIQRSVSANSLCESTYAEDQNNLTDVKYVPIHVILNPYAEIRIFLAQLTTNLETMNRMIQTVNFRSYSESEMEEIRNMNLRIGNQLMEKFRDFKWTLPPETDYSLEARIKRTLFYGLYQSYTDIWTRNETFLQLYEQKLKKNLHLRSKIINYNSTEEEIEELIANKTTNIFVGNILEESAKERKTLRDLMDRLNELKKLEKSLEDVHALFLRIQTLVIEQSETIQRVEFHAQQAALYVDKGANELEKTDKLHKNASKNKLILFLIAIIILVIFVLISVYF